jgi:hypothetical protein
MIRQRIHLWPLAIALGIFSACGQEFTLPPQPEPQAPPTAGTYNIEKIWDLNAPTDMVSQGAFLYVIEGNSEVNAYFIEQRDAVRPSFVAPFEGLIEPVQLAIARRESTFVFVADAGDMKIKRYHFTGGAPRSSFTDTSWVEFSGLAADERLSIYVSDATRDTIFKYRSTGDRDRLIADLGSGTGFVTGPRGLHYDGENLVVADTNKDWVQRILTDSTNTAADGDPIGFDASLSSPWDVTTDRNDPNEIYIADFGTDRVLKYNISGALIDSVYSPNKLETQLTVPIDGPRHIAAEGEQVFVADPAENRIVVLLRATEGSSLPPDTTGAP